MGGFSLIREPKGRNVGGCSAFAGVDKESDGNCEAVGVHSVCLHVLDTFASAFSLRSGGQWRLLL